MTKKAYLVGAMGILLLSILAALIFLMGIRGEFVEHLVEKYPEQSFAVGFTKIDPIYGRFYAKGTCLDDDTSFPISKSFNTTEIFDDYLQYKSRNQYNAKIQKVFTGSDIESYLKSVTGGGKTLFENGGAYEQINIHLSDGVEHISVSKKVLNILKENNIAAESVIITWEEDKHVYELRLSPDDSLLPEKEIEAKVQKIK